MRGTTLLSIWLLVALCAPARTDAYCLRQSTLSTGYPSWKQPVVYRVASTASSQQQAAIDAAFASWSKVSCSALSISDGGSFAADQTAFDDHGAGVYVFWYATAAGFPGAADVPATTLLVTDGKGGIVQASIAINGFAYAWASDGNTSAFDLQAEMTSLVGMALGLRTSKSSSSVMTGVLSYGDTSKRALQPDDEAGLRYLYGDGNPACPTPPAPGADGCADVPTAGSTTPPPSNPPPSNPPASNPPASTGGNGCTSSAQCAADQVCTAEGTCVLSDGAGSGAPCASYVECDGGEVCTAEGTCARLGATPVPAETPASSEPPAAATEAPADDTSLAGRCTSSAECGPGAICSAEGLCFHEDGAGGGGGGGCAIARAPHAAGAAPLLLLLVLGLLAVARRR